DGDELFARLIRAKLERWGHTVVVERDGAAAFRRLQKEPFRMVILDWDLPGMSGPELCAGIRSLRRDRYTYIIFYTDKTDKDSLVAGLESGADDYLTKPLNTVELRLRMKNGKRLLNLEDTLREGPGADESTGVVNAAGLRQFFRVVLAEAQRTGSHGSLAFVHVENFRTVFREAGYAPAQALMVEVAGLLQRNCRKSDLVARISEDRFCVMLQNTSIERCTPVLERLRSQLANLSVYVDDV